MFGFFNSKESKLIKVIKNSKLFDTEYYINQSYFKGELNKLKPEEHYFKQGWKLGLNPSELFDGNKYLEMYNDVKKSGMNPLFHYEMYGKNEGRQIFKVTNNKHKDKQKNITNVNITTSLSNYDSNIKNEIYDSGLWDENYYLEKAYQIYREDLFNGNYKTPLEHYILKGWKYGFKPSKFFTYRAPVNCQICPLIYFLSIGRFIGYQFESNEWPADNLRLSNNRKERVIYTCIVGGYDKLINHSYIDDSYDYICFTDDKDLLSKESVGVWRIVPLVFNSSDPGRNNRWHKFNPHVFLKEYNESIYIDANINIRTSYLYDFIKSNQDKLIMVPYHYERFCVFREYEKLIAGKRFSEDEKDLMKKEKDYILRDGMEYNYGMSENNIIYRKHGNKKIIAVDELIWEMIQNYSRRDQLCFSYALWKNQISYEGIQFNNVRIDFKDFWIVKHDSERKGEEKEPYCLGEYDLINNANIVSFDIFDTLIYRPFDKPSDLFKLIEKKYKREGFYNERVLAEKKCREQNSKEEITYDQIYEIMPSEYKDLKSIEVYEEKNVCLPIYRTKKLLDYARSKNKRVIGISNMYLSKEVINEILQINDIYLDELYVSSEIGLTKRTGNLYKYVLSVEKITNKDIVHFGDNEIGDIAATKALNIASIMIPKTNKLIDRNYLASCKNTIGANLLAGLNCYIPFSSLQHEFKDENKFNYYRFGYKYGGALAYKFIPWIYEKINELGIKDVFFVARDGYSMKKCFDLIKNDDINTYYLYSPRALSLCVTLDYDSENWQQVSTIANFYRKILSKSVPADYCASEEWRKFDRNFIDNNYYEIYKESLKLKDLYKKYIESLSNNASRVAIVDFGTFNFTAQKALCSCVSKVYGFYMRARPKNPVSLTYESCDKNLETVGKINPNVVEMLFTSPENPITSIDNNLLPVYKDSNKFEKQRSEIYPYISRGLVDGFNKLYKIDPSGDFLSIEEINLLFDKLWNKPLTWEKKSFKNIYHAYDSSHNKYIPLFTKWQDKNSVNKIKNKQMQDQKLINIKNSLADGIDITNEDKVYILKSLYKKAIGRELNIQNPKYYSEKLQYLKFEKNDLANTCADKVSVRSYISKVLGTDKFLVPIIGIYENATQINFKTLPKKFVLKVNWGSGENIIVNDKNSIDENAIRKQLSLWMEKKSNHYFRFLELPYRDIKPKILCEEYLEGFDSTVPDYKIFCFNGKPEFLYIVSNRNIPEKYATTFFDLNGKYLNIKQNGHRDNPNEKIPEHLNEMVSMAKKLCSPFKHVRVDFYEVNNKIYIGELTFFHFAGLIKIDPKWDLKLGKMLKI